MKQPAPPNLPDQYTAADLPDHDLVDEGYYDRLEFAGAVLSGQEATNAELTGCRFHRADLSGTIISKTLFTDCEVVHSNLANLSTDRSTLRRVRIADSRATGLLWVDGVLRDVTFTDCRLDLASFRFSTFTPSVLFERCDLPRADFTNADLRGARFVDCDLSGAEFSHAKMAGAHFAGCNLDRVRGITSFAGATVRSDDLFALTLVLAEGLGITIEPA